MTELAASAFLIGLLGGVHCVTMCGGIVGALNLAPRRVIPLQVQGNAALTATSLSGGAMPLHLAYSGGRIASYAVAGALVGGVGGVAALAESMLPVQMLLGVAANVLLVALGLYLAGFGALIARLERAGSSLWRRVAPFGRRFLPADTPGRAFAVGAVWGWLPCGLVYSVLATALMSGGAAQGGAVMLAFGLGTLPNLVAAGVAAQRMRALLARPLARRTAGALVAGLGVLGLARVPGLVEHVRAGLLCVVS